MVPKKEIIQSVKFETVPDDVVGKLEHEQIALETKVAVEPTVIQPKLYEEAEALNGAIQNVQRQQLEQKSSDLNENEVIVESLDEEGATTETFTPVDAVSGLADVETVELSAEEIMHEAEDQFAVVQSTPETVEIGESPVEDTIIPDLETSQDFIAYVEAQEQMPEVAVVIETAPERPLGEVLATIAVYFEQAPKEAHIELPPVLEKLQQLFTDEVLGTLAIENPEITPELNTLLLEVLETLGYSNRQEVLQAYIDDLGTKEALAILAYVSRLARGYDAQENSVFSTGITTQDRLSSHIGRVLMQLIHPISLERAA